MTVLYLASSQPDVGVAGRIPDWITHGTSYLILGALVCRALAGGSTRRLTGRRAIVAVLICLLYGTTDEWHQSFVPPRNASWGDVAKDLAGAAAGALLWQAIAARREDSGS
jgi:VanZ family protein